MFLITPIVVFEFGDSGSIGRHRKPGGADRRMAGAWPGYGIQFLLRHQITGLFVPGAVLLVVTGTAFLKVSPGEPAGSVC